MGQCFSTSNNVLVTTDKEQYYPGDRVTGNVCLNCVQAFTCSSIELKVTGFERCWWSETVEDFELQGGNQQERQVPVHRTIEYSGRRDFFKVQLPLHSFRQKVDPGQYQFPFAFLLPHDVPGCFLYASGSIRAEVAYKVKAVCSVPGMFKPNIRFTHSVTVYERPAAAVNAAVQSKEQDMASCCCYSRGHTAASVHMDRDAYAPGDTASLVIEVDNSVSQVDFKCIEVNLMRRLTLTAENLAGDTRWTDYGSSSSSSQQQHRQHWHSPSILGPGFNSSSSSSQQHPQSQQQQQHQQHQYSHHSHQRDNCSSMALGFCSGGGGSLKEVQTCVYKNEYLGVNAGAYCIGRTARRHALFLDPSLPPATRGCIVRCEYWAEVALIAGPCTNSLRLQLPLTLHARRTAAEWYAQAPESWKPTQVFEAKTIEVPSAPLTPPGIMQMPSRTQPDPSEGTELKPGAGAAEQVHPTAPPAVGLEAALPWGYPELAAPLPMQQQRDLEQPLLDRPV